MVSEPVMTKRRRARGEDGASLVLVALMMIPLFVITSFAIDLGSARAWRRQSQNSADAGALAGAQELRASPATAKQTAADFAALDALGVNSAGGPLACDVAVFHMPVMPPHSSCWTVTDGDAVAHISVATPYDRTKVPNLSSTVTSDAELIWVRVCRSLANHIATIWGDPSTEVCTQAVARLSYEGVPWPAMFAIKARNACQNSVGMNPSSGKDMNVYDHAGQPSGLVMSNCPVSVGGSNIAGSPDVEVRSTGSITGTPSGGWGSIVRTPNAPALADPWGPGGTDPVPDFDFNAPGADCYPDDDAKTGCGSGTSLISCHNIDIEGEGTRRVTVWRPGHYGGTVKVDKTHCGQEPEIHYFMPGLYDFSSNISWDASESRRIYFLTNNGNRWNDPDDPGCGHATDGDIWGPSDPDFSCPTPPSGAPSLTNRGGGATWFLGNSGSSSEMYGIHTLKMYPPRSGTYANFSLFCNRPNNPNSGQDQVQFDGSLENRGAYDLNGFFYCQNRQIEVHGDLTIKNGVLWANDIEWDGGANINVYTPVGWGEINKIDDFGLEQ